MCSCDGDDPADVYRETSRKARKPHRCRECSATIPAGHGYTRAFVAWEGTAESFAICADCQALHREWSDLARAHRLCAPCWTFGGMLSAIMEWAEEAEHELSDRLRMSGTVTRVEEVAR